MNKEYLRRTELLLGEDAMKRLRDARVIVCGVGGVGSWCAESLVRSGVGHLTMVDHDLVCPSNINRQLMATSATIGMAKVEVLRQRLQEISPGAEIVARKERFNAESAASFGLEGYDCIIDCIDSLKDKMLLIECACNTGARFYSSMGAALKIDPTRVKVAEFWDVQGDPLARSLRKRFHKEGRCPSRPFQCVYSEEILPMRGIPGEDEARVNGTMVHVTAIFGHTLAGLALKELSGLETP